MNATILADVMGCDESVAARWSKPLDEAAQRFGVDRPARVAAWLAMIKRASSGLSVLEENLSLGAAQLVAKWPAKFAMPDQDELGEVVLRSGKRNALIYARRPQETANYVFAGESGNGSEYSGDGWNFRPRGLLKISGRETYRAFGEAVGRQRIIRAPQAVALPEVAAMAAGWLWDELGLSKLADRAERDAEAISEIEAKFGLSGARGAFDRAMFFLK